MLNKSKSIKSKSKRAASFKSVSIGTHLSQVITIKFIQPIVSSFVLLFVGLSAATLAADPQTLPLPKTIEISKAVMPEVPAVSRTSAVYLTIKNLSAETLVIDHVETNIARHAMFHNSVEQDGVAKMQHLDQLTIPANQSLELKPGGAHIMLMGLKTMPESKQFELILGNSKFRYKVKVDIVPRS